MIKKYEFGDTTQFSPHFNAKEFRCKCGKEHEVLIADELIDKLESCTTALTAPKLS